MSSPYDLSSGNKGFKALVTMDRISNYRESARHIRAMNAAYDPMDSEISKSNRYASELEKKAFELEKEMKEREERE